MTRVERNGLSGLLVRGAVIALAVVMFGCAPKAPAGDISSTISIASR
jgi:hypothetical protein